MCAETRKANDSRAYLRLAGLGLVIVILIGATGPTCDQNAQAVFRQTSTANIGEGVKTFLAGNPEAGVGTITTAVIDGAVASIVAAGDGPNNTSSSSSSSNKK